MPSVKFPRREGTSVNCQTTKQLSLSARSRPCVALSRKVGSSCGKLKTRALGHLLQFKDHRPQLSRCQLKGSTFKDDHILNNGSLYMWRRAGVRTDPRPPTPSLSLSLAQPTRTSTERKTHRFPQVRFHAACWPSCARGRAPAPCACVYPRTFRRFPRAFFRLDPYPSIQCTYRHLLSASCPRFPSLASRQHH